MSTGVHAAGAAGFEQGGGIIVLQVRVTDRFGEEAGAAAKDEVWGVPAGSSIGRHPDKIG